MEPVVMKTIITYVSMKFLDQFLKEEGYGRCKSFLFAKKKYQRQLISTIYDVIEIHEKSYPHDGTNNKFPFYKSQILFKTLNEYILFKPLISTETLLKLFEGNPNIIIPAQDELNAFYKLFVDKVNSNKKLVKLFIEENYQSKIFEIFDVVDSIDKKVTSIKKNIEKTTFTPTKKWFKEQCHSSILDLGNRYTHELNFQLEASNIFGIIGRTQGFEEKIINQIDRLMIKGKKILKIKAEIQEYLQQLEDCLENLSVIIESNNLSGIDNFPVESLKKIVGEIKEINYKIYLYFTDNENFERSDRPISELNDIGEFKSEISILYSTLSSQVFDLVNNPVLVLEGEAGIGKSHMIGDVVTKRIASDYQSIFLLGQHFVTDEDPWTQIFKRLQINITAPVFLSEINDFAKSHEKRIIFFVDAINEGRGKFVWPSFVSSFISEFNKYSNLGVVLTIRSSYKKLIFPEKKNLDLSIVQHTVLGFRNVEYEASNLFFDNYKIERPSVPLLHREFQNPLFLKLFCEAITKSKSHKIPDGLQGISAIIEFYINSINDVLSKPLRCHYSNNINLVKRSINSIVSHRAKHPEKKYITYEKAYDIVDDTVERYTSKKGFIDELITEGVLSKNVFWSSPTECEEGIYLTYERFEDHLVAQFLLKQYPNFETEFKVGGDLNQYVKNEKSIILNQGLIDAFSIQIPEKNGLEFFEVVPLLKDKGPVLESFLNSLIWRKDETVTSKSLDYVNNHVLKHHDSYDLFWETILSVATVPNHFFNAISLHKHLMKQILPNRDAGWTQLLKYKFSDDSAVKQLIDWAWKDNDKTYISDESIKLSAITLTWFHTSTNRQIRDCSTKALICLLQNRLSVLMEIFKLFETVNDPYIYERLFAVAYGCALRTNQKELLSQLSEYIYRIIFENKNDVYPHILLRDYARGVIEYTNYLSCQLSFEISEVRPPYTSSWPATIPSIKELEESYNNSDYFQLWDSVMGFGDFARYVIGTNSHHSEWSGTKKGEAPIDREKLFETFKFSLNSNQLSLFAELNPIITSSQDPKALTGGMATIKVKVAVGRKSEAELAKIKKSFKQTLDQGTLSFYEEEIEPYLDHNHNLINTGKTFDLRIAQRFIFSRIIELGWNKDDHYNFDRQVRIGSSITSHNERIGKKYQWIAYYEYMAKLSDNFIKYERWNFEMDREEPYQGPWDPYVRDIDPTMLIKKAASYNEDQSNKYWWIDNFIFNWDGTPNEWINSTDNLPNFKNLLKVNDPENEEWLILEGYPEWAEPKKIGEKKWDYPHKRLWCHVRSYIVQDIDFEPMKNWAIKQNFMGRWMPESHDTYELFSREYYWSPAHKHFIGEYPGGIKWVDIIDRESRNRISQVHITTESFLWEEEFDYSKEESITFLKPSTFIYKSMNLKYGIKEGEFLNALNETVCFATNIYNDSKRYLLIKKAPFLELLEERGLKIIWTVSGEKQIIGGGDSRANAIGRLEIDGVYYHDNGILDGDFRTKNT
ncbi:AVAST type 2 anti-phage system protein Avs2 [Desulfoluna sp.]|uniref:AVAST type 2 anti-phage system protein Avs2 n=1 Tax=Desulfoluna sp. TaxID=2045199 RepID=UPI00261D4000|nr:AVAST type 2 anti-phage system protein Avs2 [Desulfoluna sp.]